MRTITGQQIGAALIILVGSWKMDSAVFLANVITIAHGRVHVIPLASIVYATIHSTGLLKIGVQHGISHPL
jgi:hypothetical protein